MTDTDPRLIRLVARRFNDLKGLRQAPIAAALLGSDVAWSSTGSVLVTFLGGFAGFGVAALAYAFVADTYEHLGRVCTHPRSKFAGWIGGAIVMGMTSQADLHIPGPSIVWLGASLYWLWLAIDGWPWRWYQALTCLSAIYVAFGRVAGAHPAPFAWMAPRLWVFALAITATGIADHVLLLRVMRPTDDAAEEGSS